jgi:predicted  nucleic acid-binding Zn-ribbon protein
MQNQAALLYQLQTIDLTIAQRRARLKAIDAQLRSDETIAQATQALEAAEKAIKPWQTRARDLELESKSVGDKIKSADGDLYSGKISSPKALQELQDEIAALTRHQNQLEDNLLDAMMQIEEHQGQITSAQQALTDAQTALATQHSELLEEKQRLEAEVAQMEQQREKSAVGIEPNYLAAYEKLRPRMRGQAVALLQSAGCATCGVEQTSMIVQQVRMGRNIVYCESCGRILADIS